ncbi:hypothetical protein [Parafrankia sp. CH37]|nr:hypothetical protein [Parafrankia sp. CH37]
MRSSEHVVIADHHQVVVYSGNSPAVTEDSISEFGDGLVAANDGGLRIFTGTTYGPVTVQVELHDEEPALPSTEWTEVSEISFGVRTGPVEIGTLMGGPIPESPDLAFSGPGWYRIRVAAQGRDRGQAGEVGERYLLATWLAPEAAANPVRKSDQIGKSFRGEEIGERPEEASEASAKNALRVLVELLQNGAGNVPPGNGGIGLEVAIESPVDRVAGFVRSLPAWPSWLGDGGIPDLQGKWVSWFSSFDGFRIEGTPVVEASSVTTTWEYSQLSAPPPGESFPGYRPLLAAPSVVRISWRTDANGTVVSLHHNDLPEPLEAPMTDLWRYYLDRLSKLCKTGAFAQHPWQ